MNAEELNKALAVILLGEDYIAKHRVIKINLNILVGKDPIIETTELIDIDGTTFNAIKERKFKITEII